MKSDVNKISMIIYEICVDSIKGQNKINTTLSKEFIFTYGVTIFTRLNIEAYDRTKRQAFDIMSQNIQGLWGLMCLCIATADDEKGVLVIQGVW